MSESVGDCVLQSRMHGSDFVTSAWMVRFLPSASHRKDSTRSGCLDYQKTWGRLSYALLASTTMLSQRMLLSETYPQDCAVERLLCVAVGGPQPNKPVCSKASRHSVPCVYIVSGGGTASHYIPSEVCTHFLFAYTACKTCHNT